MTSKRTEYDVSFKLEVARMVVDQGLTIGQLVQDMQVGRTSVNRWFAQYLAEKSGQPGISKQLTAWLISGNRRSRWCKYSCIEYQSCWLLCCEKTSNDAQKLLANRVFKVGICQESADIW